MAHKFPARDWFGTKEAADYLGVHRAWLDTHQTEVPPSYRICGARRYLVAELDAYIESKRVRKPG